MTDNNLLNSLNAAGLSETEAIVLEGLIYSESMTAGALAKRIKLKRPTVYAALDSLSEKGLVHKKMSPKAQVYSSIPGNSIVSKLYADHQQKVTLFKDATDAIKAIFAELPQKKKRNVDGFELETVTSEKGIYEYLYTSLTSEPFSAIFDPALLTPKARKIVIKFLEETEKTKNEIREIVRNGSAFNWYKKQIKNPNHLIKPAPANWEIDCDLIISREKITLISYDEKQGNALRVLHKPFASILRSMFELVWESL